MADEGSWLELGAELDAQAAAEAEGAGDVNAAAVGEAGGGVAA